MKTLLEGINDAEKNVSALLHQHWQDEDLPLEHLERAKAHLNEAWIAADGQNARTVQKLVEDIESYAKLFKAIASAPAGAEFEIAGKKWIKAEDK
jgi:hypothetical protein